MLRRLLWLRLRVQLPLRMSTGAEGPDRYSDETAETLGLSNFIVVISRDDMAKFMAAIADLEQFADRTAGKYPLGTTVEDAITDLSRIASEIDEQTSTQ